LSGGLGADTLKGGRGDDRLSGGADDDRLFGGLDADRFVLAPGGGFDRIADFEDDVDTIVLKAFDFDDVADALARARETDAGDVVFRFGSGDRLLVRDVTEAELANDLLV